MSNVLGRRTVLTRSSLALVALLAFIRCGGGPKVVTVGVEESDFRVRQAQMLVGQGHYSAFKRAVRLYGDLYRLPSMRPKISGSYVEACLLLALRERQVGIESPAVIDLADRLIGENPGLKGLAPYAVVIRAVPVNTPGVMSDIDTTFRSGTNAENFRSSEEAVRKRAETEGFAAYVMAARACSFGRFSGDFPNAAQYLKAYPDSVLMKYLAATCGENDPQLLAQLLARDPGFAEAHFHLGQAALKRGELLTAEKELLEAYAAIPESPQTRILLAGIYFATEEFDQSLAFYDLTLQISPEYRDALLGKAVCLSYMGRYEESMAALNRILELGYWLMGESHYWLAWNLRELKRNPEALIHVDEAKGRLPTNAEVFALSGTIALDLDNFDRAEKDFLESLQYNPAGTESLFGLGTVATRRNRWEAAGTWFEKAGQAFDGVAAALRVKIDEIENSTLSPERRSKLLRNRQGQLDRTLLTGATAFYDAAAAYLNASQPEKARACAARSAVHPALREKTDELLRSIKD